MNYWMWLLSPVGILGTAIVLGTDMFFLTIGRAALKMASPSAGTEIMGFFHLFADARMPIWGVSAILCNLLLVVLREYGMLPSMSGPGNPYDNAACESFLRTLKREEIYAGNYRDFEDLREHLEEFIERYYNRGRLHSALKYCSPEAFETQVRDGSPETSAAMVPFQGF